VPAVANPFFLSVQELHPAKENPAAVMLQDFRLCHA
jgi:hypothetical protein